MKDLKNAISPSKMPVNSEEWFKQLNLCNFINSYYQYRDIQTCNDCKKILIIGPGQGLDTVILKWRGYEVKTLDIDDTFRPDYIGSVHDLSMFKDGEFDVAVASHVLEHLAESYFDLALKEIARIAKYAVIYLPVHGRHAQIRLIPGVKNINISFIIDFFNYFKKTDGIKPKYMANMHYWEVGLRGYKVKDIKKRMSQFFNIISVYRNIDWLPSQNFVLKSKLIS